MGRGIGAEIVVKRGNRRYKRGQSWYAVVPDLDRLGGNWVRTLGNGVSGVGFFGGGRVVMSWSTREEGGPHPQPLSLCAGEGSKGT